jgi:hypothetical protein
MRRGRRCFEPANARGVQREEQAFNAYCGEPRARPQPRGSPRCPVNRDSRCLGWLLVVLVRLAKDLEVVCRCPTNRGIYGAENETKV